MTLWLPHQRLIVPRQPIGVARAVVTSVQFSPAAVSPDLWFEVKGGTGDLKGSTSGTYSGDLNDETAILAALAGTETCTQWDDIAGTATNVVPNAAAQEPAWLQASENNFNTAALDFDGSDDTLEGAALDLSGGASIAAVFEADDVTAIAAVFESIVGTTNRFALSLETGTLRLSWYNGTAYQDPQSGSISVATKYVVQGFWNGTDTIDLYINGALQVGTNSPSTPAAAGISIGCSPEATRNFNGRIVAVIVKAGDWSANRINMDNYLKSKYGVSF